MLAAIASAIVSLLLPAPVVAVASDGPYVAVAEGRGSRDCDRVSIWVTSSARLIKLGRKTSCELTSTGGGVASVTIARNRALWLHYTGGNIREWSLWTATTTKQEPRRLAFATSDPDAAPPIVIGGGDFDRRQGHDSDVLPYAVGRTVVVLNAAGSRSHTWEAPANVTALDSDPGLLTVAVQDGRIFVLDNGALVRTYPGTTAATSLGFAGGDSLAAQRGRRLEVTACDDGTRTLALRTGEQAFLGSGWAAALSYRGRIRVRRLCGGPPVVDVPGTVAALDNWRFTYADGRRVTTRLLATP